MKKHVDAPFLLVLCALVLMGLALYFILRSGDVAGRLTAKKWLENILLGSVTEKVLNLTTIPLYIIPTKKH